MPYWCGLSEFPASGLPSSIHLIFVKPEHSLDSLTRPTPGPAPARRLPAWSVPAAIFAGFAILFLALFRDRLLPAPKVEVALVLATASTPSVSNTTAAAGTMLFQASGWVEPDPLPIKATALVDGVIDTVHVLEGQQVAKGSPLATLVVEDFRLAHAAAEQKHRILMATRDAHIASISSAQKKLESAQATEKAALTLQEEAADQNARYSRMKSGTVPEADVVSARLRLDRERLQSSAAEADSNAALAEITRLELETKVRDAEVAAAAVAVDQAKLSLDRTRIVSPVDGRVLRLLAAPGQKKRLDMDDPDSSTIAILYQPDKLQVRVDVPLADAARLSVGQRAKIRCGLLPDRVFEGEVTRITGEADVQRNTLQAKVRIIDPSDQLRPEMLCRVEFLGSAKTDNTTSGSLSMWIPESALTDNAAWVCDPESQRVSKRSVRSTNESRDGFIRIAEGIRPGEHVVLTPRSLREGQRITPHLKQP
jgi:HlyD family secretion protein